MYFVYKGLHKDRSARICVCVRAKEAELQSETTDIIVSSSCEF